MILGEMIAKSLKGLGKVGNKIVDHGPDIAMAVGIAGFAFTVYSATKAPEKAKAAEEQYKKDGDKKKLVTGYAKAWGTTAVGFAVATGCTLGAYGTIKARYVERGIALATLRHVFMKYRQNVVDDQGVEKDMMYRMGIREKIDIQEKEDGTQEVKKLTDGACEPDPKDYYLFIFDERNSMYCHEPTNTANWGTLNTLYKVLNENYRASRDGRMTLKDFVTNSGFSYMLEDEKFAKFAGRAGWNRNRADGDDYISFGPMFDAISKDPRDYIMGRTPPMIIEVNCVGDIYGDD